MPRTGRRRSLSIAAAVAAVLAAPAAAQRSDVHHQGRRWSLPGARRPALRLACRRPLPRRSPATSSTSRPATYLGAEFEDGRHHDQRRCRRRDQRHDGVLRRHRRRLEGQQAGDQPGHARRARRARSPAMPASSSATPSSSPATARAFTSPAARRTRSCARRSPRAASRPPRCVWSRPPARRTRRCASSPRSSSAAGPASAPTRPTPSCEAPAGDITIQAYHITAAGSTYGVELDSSQSAIACSSRATATSRRR